MSTTAKKTPAKKTTTAKRAAAAGAKAPADHQAKKNEADPGNPDDIVFEYEGHTYVIEAGAFDDIEIAELLEEGKNILVIRQILGADQWQAWKDRARGENGRTKASDAEPFLRALFGAAGQGNSDSSSGS
jgi:hypothetical protein